MDFFFWGYIKDIIHSEMVESLPDFCRRTSVSIAAVPVNVLRREAKWNFVSIYIGPSVVIVLNCIKLCKTWRDCLIVFVNKKFLCQSSE
jgi:hypothetical protein